jgi:hypothetical protein
MSKTIKKFSIITLIITGLMAQTSYTMEGSLLKTSPYWNPVCRSHKNTISQAPRFLDSSCHVTDKEWDNFFIVIRTIIPAYGSEIFETLSSHCLDEIMGKIIDFKKKNGYFPRGDLLKYVETISIILQDILKDRGINFTFDPVDGYRKINDNTLTTRPIFELSLIKKQQPDSAWEKVDSQFSPEEREKLKVMIAELNRAEQHHIIIPGVTDRIEYKMLESIEDDFKKELDNIYGTFEIPLKERKYTLDNLIKTLGKPVFEVLENKIYLERLSEECLDAHKAHLKLYNFLLSPDVCESFKTYILAKERK